MSVRLLLDENLSERLLPLLLDRFPDSSHVRLLGLGGADDPVIWEQALSEGALLVTKDEDFLRLSVTRGFPPKVICLDIGNAGNAATAALQVARPHRRFSVTKASGSCWSLSGDPLAAGAGDPGGVVTGAGGGPGQPLPAGHYQASRCRSATWAKA